MTKGVFLHRSDSIYDDRPDEQYQFPAQYLSRAVQFVGETFAEFAGERLHHGLHRVDVALEGAREIRYQKG